MRFVQLFLLAAMVAVVAILGCADSGIDAENVNELAMPDESSRNTDPGNVKPGCEDLCGDGVCQEIVCQAIGCPCAETPENCPKDCRVL